MPTINNDERLELLRLATSTSMKEDMEIVTSQRHNPVLIDGEVNMDRALEFLTQFNEFINHQPKSFEPIIDRDMRL